jgi:hypothetical protein
LRREFSEAAKRPAKPCPSYLRVLSRDFVWEHATSAAQTKKGWLLVRWATAFETCAEWAKGTQAHARGSCEAAAGTCFHGVMMSLGFLRGATEARGKLHRSGSVQGRQHMRCGFVPSVKST